MAINNDSKKNKLVFFKLPSAIKCHFKDDSINGTYFGTALFPFKCCFNLSFASEIVLKCDVASSLEA